MKRETRLVKLNPVDIAVAFSVAYRLESDGQWSPKDVRNDLNLPWSSVNLSLSRLEYARVMRGKLVYRRALATMLPSLQYLMPIVVDRKRRVRGVPTGASAPVFDGCIVHQTQWVWKSDAGEVEGVPVEPLHPSLPEAVMDHAGLYAVFACLDAIRGGRAREVGVATTKLRALLGLPEPMVA